MDGNSLCDYMIYEKTKILDQMLMEEEEIVEDESALSTFIKKSVANSYKKSLIETKRKSVIRMFVMPENDKCYCDQVKLPKRWDQFS